MVVLITNMRDKRRPLTDEQVQQPSQHGCSVVVARVRGLIEEVVGCTVVTGRGLIMGWEVE